MSIQVNPFIFREYDVRGLVDRDLTPEVVEHLGKAYGTYVRRHGYKQVVVGRDGRLSSPQLKEALIKGILSTGCNVTDIGMCPTPVVYFSIFHLDKEGGIAVTGSHNPPEYNGFKICVGKETIFGKQIQHLRQLIEEQDYETGTGKYDSYDIIPDYIAFMKDNIKIQGKHKLALDAGNGVAGLVAPKIFAEMRCEITPLYCEVDGNFPHHGADPTVVANMQDLITTVKKENLELGFAYDGDGDRLGVVDEKGNILWGDQLLVIFSRDILKEHPGAKIIGEVKCSQLLFDDIAKHGGQPIMWKVGHSLIKSKLKEEKALLAGEMSGHIFFADRYFGFDDGIYASLRFLEIVDKTGKKPSELIADLPKTYSTPEIRTECPDEIKFEVVKKAQSYFPKHYNTVTIDGVRIIFEDGWALIRASNTQPVLVLRFEATSEERLEEIRNIVEEKLEEFIAEVKNKKD
ncbi:MAG: phosphomannomutase/phosphoglucomutase [Candidatus Desulfofervidaceae bacterium]|nr:phosphomannomutase/phosphoglucomutase [Candidatus Desulfofervidaceae bacterium]